MRKHGVLLCLVFAVAVPRIAAQAEIPLPMLVEAAVERSASIEQSVLREQLSEIRRDTVFGAVTPGLTLAADPAYGLRSVRAPDPSAIPPDSVDTITQSTGISLSARQLLPTGGVLAGEIGSGFSVTTSDPDGSDSATRYSLSPSFSLSLSQPLFVDGALIDVDQFFLNRDSALLGVTAARTTTSAVQEQVVLSVVSLASRRNALRRAVESQVLQQDLTRQRLEQARIRREQGQGSQQEIVTLQVQLNRLQDAELQSRLAAREVELELTRLSGLTVAESTRIAIPPPVVPPVGVRSEAAEPLSVVQARREVEAARIDYELARKQALMTADLFLSLTPRYADERANPDSLSGAFTDYDGEGAGIDVNVGLNLSVPLTEGASRRRTVEQAAIALELAESALAERQQELGATVELNTLRVQTLEQRISLLEFDLEFEREQLVSDLELRELGTVTPFQIAQRRSSIRAAEIDLQNLRSDLYLRQLELHRLQGGDPLAFVIGREAEVE